NWWRTCQSSQRDSRLEDVQQGAAVCIQSAWRGFKERRQLLLWREAAVVIQRNWRQYWRGQAALRIQTAWRRHRARELYLRQRDIAILLQAAGRGYLARQRFRELQEQRLKTTRLPNGKTSLLPEERKLRDMGLDQSIWVQDRSKQTLVGSVEASGGHILEEMELEMTEGMATVQSTSEVAIRERPQTLEDPNQRTRAKRESRRMRELEQAKFSLELLKVRSTGGTSPTEERRWSMELVSENAHTPQGTPDSQSSKGSFELLNIDDYFKDKAPCAEPEDPGSPSVPDKHDVFSDIPESALPSDTPAPDILSKPSSQPEPPKIQNSLPTFYTPPSESSSLIVKPTLNSATLCPDGTSKPMKDRKESTRRPMVVVISMQKESLINEADVKPPEVKDSAAQTSKPPSPAQPSSDRLYVLERLEKLNEEKQERQKHQQQQNEKQMMEQIRQQKHILKEQRQSFAQHEREMFEKQRVEALQRIEQSRQEASGGKPDRLLTDRGPAPIAQPETDFSSQPLVPEREAAPSIFRDQPKDSRNVAEGWAPKLTLESRADEARRRINTKPSTQNVNINMSERPGNMFFSPKAKVSKLDKDLTNQGKPPAVQNEVSLFGYKSAKSEVGRPGHKKARMARTRSDFLTRGSNAMGEGESEEEEYDETPLSPGTPLPKQDSEESTLEACHSDSEMPATANEEQKNMYKTMSSGELGKSDARKNSHGDGRVRGKMRFWGKAKHGEKKSSRERLLCVGDTLEGDFAESALLMEEGVERLSPPQSPDLTLQRELKENKDPSPKVKRRRSVKISSVTLEPVQWQNDALQILTCASDYRSMNDFLMKKITDLDTEDGKKDTMVDVVFKKALKEFRLNIFNSYSTALAMDDGKSIRYKDLYALFEQILEKNMRQEQRDWSESPVTVWVNTFKVFLDEFMTEHKPLDGSMGR
ncbi:unconventional myosin-IXAa-like, partial [Garra rufa]|uniref:unconventional myosin-IXAa-like n=1 Tax=Garra rufa TaxID=137080 RepID=UPI003CCEB479